jgi:uncharacterized membrane protein (UPF0127 family)
MGRNTAQLMFSIVLLTPCSLLKAEVVKLKINERSFTLKISKTPTQHSQGLMYKHYLPARTGMIFVGGSNAHHPFNMWMKNTYIPLDMLFIGPDYRINCIKESAQPFSLTDISCPEPTVAVIEINGGEANKYHLAKGMKVTKIKINER